MISLVKYSRMLFIHSSSVIISLWFCVGIISMPLICIFYRHETVLIIIIVPHEIMLVLCTLISPAHNKVHSHATHTHTSHSLHSVGCNGTFRSKRKLFHVLKRSRAANRLFCCIFLILLSQTWIPFLTIRSIFGSHPNANGYMALWCSIDFENWLTISRFKPARKQGKR